MCISEGRRWGHHRLCVSAALGSWCWLRHLGKQGSIPWPFIPKAGIQCIPTMANWLSLQECVGTHGSYCLATLLTAVMREEVQESLRCSTSWVGFWKQQMACACLYLLVSSVFCCFNHKWEEQCYKFLPAQHCLQHMSSQLWQYWHLFKSVIEGKALDIPVQVKWSKTSYWKPRKLNRGFQWNAWVQSYLRTKIYTLFTYIYF